MNTYLLRVEGVNLASFVYDTQDLSTVRGGGLALLRAIGWVDEHVGSRLRDEDGEGAWEVVTRGASNGIFRFRAPGPREAEKVRDEVARFLSAHRHAFRTLEGEPEHLELAHATFVADVVEASGDFGHDRRRLLAKNRFRQLRSPSLAVPEGSAAVPCALDRLRPATEEIYASAGAKIRVSESLYQRRQYGRAQKQSFYESETQEELRQRFSQDFDRLTADPAKGNLHHKMAVVYLDGNGFGALQDELCTTAEIQQEFDRQLREQRREALRRILVPARDDPDFRELEDPKTKNRPIRFETLLWGGDELLWVVPAWRGWRVLETFFERDWKIELGSETRPLTHAAGLVFCHHNAPIYRIRRLAEELAGLAKRKSREENLVAYQVLESFDHAAGDLVGFRRRRTPEGIELSGLILPAGSLPGARRHAAPVKLELPKSRLYAVVDALFGRGPGYDEAVGRAEASLPPESRGDLERLRESLGGGQAAWLHLAELWDYLV